MAEAWKILTVAAAAAAAVACSKSDDPAPKAPAPAATPAAAGEIVRLDPAFDALVAPGARVEKLADGFKFTEGPLWRGGRLWLSDLVGNRLYAVTTAGEKVLLLDKAGGLPNPPEGSYLGSNGLATDAEGAVLAAQHGARRIVRFDESFAATPVVERFEGKRLNSPNDLVFAPDGALWFTDPPYGLAGQDEDPAKEVAFNGVYRYAGGRLTAPIRDLTRPNGLGFSADGRTLYVANSGPAMRVMKYAVAADGTAGPGEVFAEFTAADGPGLPDGLKLDAAGNVWLAGPGGVHVLSPAGKRLGVVKLPEVAANLAWTDEGRTLYVTASTGVYRLAVATPGQTPLYKR